jgi:hypothetical protein
VELLRQKNLEKCFQKKLWESPPKELLKWVANEVKKLFKIGITNNNDQQTE